MAFDVKGTFAWALLELCEAKELSKITVRDLEDKTGFSRPTFYRHFKDKDDLVQYVYDKIVLRQPAENCEEESCTGEEINTENIYEWIVADLRGMKKYRRFMKMACMQDGLNSLWAHMISEGRKSDLEWHRIMHGGELTKEMKDASDYHSAASVYITIEWILTDMQDSEEELADKIIRNRVMSLPEVLGIQDEDNIYVKTHNEM